MYLKKNNKVKKTDYNFAYLVVINFCEEETYFFDNIKDMYKFCHATSIKQCLEYFSSMLTTVTIYRINRSYDEI